MKKIVLSNVSTHEKDDIVINFNRVVKRGWDFFDNAVVNCLRLMNILHVKNVAIAGFDEFKDHYNETYADTSLPTVNPDGDWDKLNEEILDMFKDFKKTVGDSMNIEFITESVFDI